MRYFFLFFFIFSIIATIFTELYLQHIGLGNPIRYDSNYVYGFAPKENQKKKIFKK